MCGRCYARRALFCVIAIAHLFDVIDTIRIHVRPAPGGRKSLPLPAVPACGALCRQPAYQRFDGCDCRRGKNKGVQGFVLRWTQAEPWALVWNAVGVLFARGRLGEAVTETHGDDQSQA